MKMGHKFIIGKHLKLFQNNFLLSQFHSRLTVDYDTRNWQENPTPNTFTEFYHTSPDMVHWLNGQGRTDLYLLPDHRAGLNDYYTFFLLYSDTTA